MALKVNRAFADAGLDWHWSRERYRELLSTSGGKERILRYIEEEHPEFLDRDDLKEWIAGLHKSKTNHYKAMMAAGEVELRPGVERKRACGWPSPPPPARKTSLHSSTPPLDRAHWNGSK